MLRSGLCFMFWFFGHKACGILAPWPGIEPAPSALEGKVLTTGPPGKSGFQSFDHSEYNSWHMGKSLALSLTLKEGPLSPAVGTARSSGTCRPLLRWYPLRRGREKRLCDVRLCPADPPLAPWSPDKPTVAVLSLHSPAPVVSSERHPQLSWVRGAPACPSVALAFKAQPCHGAAV